ncbi:MAG TPA: glycosyltransferase family 87 protein [Aggregatilinea sp.]|uniref:glycosyltransferase family 87 protein n=1 Tax=Aggregatilinea sp. TaxID=2806333 RepID=UPI002B53C8FB|nr:glycosyltransferase family 87 protein [Aggregatilinea sp.]HML21151.1 glycosyltransferase family 87 protein [Aggregatilinea sp.]
MKKLIGTTSLPEMWARSRTFRRVLVATLIFAVLRLLMQFFLLAGTVYEGETEDGFFPPDLQVYIDAADHFRAGEDLYLKGSLAHLESHYTYAPSFAVLAVPLLWLPPAVVAWGDTLFHLFAYIVLYFWWNRIFRKLELHRAREGLAWLLPVWLIFSAFWGDLNYLNIYVPMALLGTLLIEAILDENLGWSVLWLSIVLQIKPQWAFAAAVPLLLGHYRFFWKLAASTLAAFVAIDGVTMLVMGPAYGWQQHIDYVRLLERLSRDFPWREFSSGFLGYNHSITQTVIYLAGNSAASLRLAGVIKLAILLPLVAVALRALRHPRRGDSPIEAQQLGLEWAFALYMGAFIWLDMVWELTLGIAVFTYLIVTVEGSRIKTWLWAVFMVYALADLWQMVSYLALGDAALIQDAYVVTDPNMYIPVVMIVILSFYALLVSRLWAATAPAIEESTARQAVETVGASR